MKRAPAFHLGVFANLPHRGGDPHVCIPLCRSLAKKGFRITLMGPIGKEWLRNKRAFAGIHRLIPLDPKTRFHRSLHEYLEKDPPNAFLNSSAYSALTETALRLRKPLYIRAIHHPKWKVFEGAPETLTRQILRSTGYLADGVIAVSDFVKCLFKREGVRKVETIHEGCDTRHFRPDPAERQSFRGEFRLDEGDIAVGTIAHLSRQKRHEVALKAIAFLKNPKRFKYFIVGGWFDRQMASHRRRLELLAARLGIRRQIIFTGYRRDVSRILNGLDLVLFPALDEGFGLAVVEAMACEKPVILSRSGAFPELIRHGREGFLVAPENPAALAKTIEHLAGDPALRKRMGRAARRGAIKNFSLETQTRRYELFFKKRLQRSSFSNIAIVGKRDFQSKHGPRTTRA